MTTRTILALVAVVLAVANPARGQWDFIPHAPGNPVIDEGFLVVHDNATLHRLRAVARYAAGNATGFVEDLEKVLDLEPGDADSRRKLTEIRDRLNL